MLIEKSLGQAWQRYSMIVHWSIKTSVFFYWYDGNCVIYCLAVVSLKLCCMTSSSNWPERRGVKRNPRRFLCRTERNSWGSLMIVFDQEHNTGYYITKVYRNSLSVVAGIICSHTVTLYHVFRNNSVAWQPASWCKSRGFALGTKVVFYHTCSEWSNQIV